MHEKPVTIARLFVVYNTLKALSTKKNLAKMAKNALWTCLRTTYLCPSQLTFFA